MAETFRSDMPRTGGGVQADQDAALNSPQPGLTDGNKPLQRFAPATRRTTKARAGKDAVANQLC
jgi:hypothetical protein